jgi:hypothetical protein
MVRSSGTCMLYVASRAIIRIGLLQIYEIVSIELLQIHEGGVCLESFVSSGV